MQQITFPNGSIALGTAEQLATLNTLADCNKGGIGAIHGYKPSTNWLQRPTVNLSVLTRFNYLRLLERKADEVKGISFADVLPVLRQDTKLDTLSDTDLEVMFDEAKGKLVGTAETTLAGVRTDAHRQGHDRCYMTFDMGVKVHLVTEKGDDGLMHPVLTDGLPMIKSIMVPVLELGRTYVQDGVRKVVNHRNPTRVKNAIESLLNKRSVGYRVLSLKPDNFTKVVLSKRIIEPSDIGSIPMELLD
jgi:hypothetical protein